MQTASEGARSIWDEYRLLGEVFRGPATVAWRAEHVISGRPARLTTVHAPPMASGVTAEAISHAFRRAAARAREFAHPDIVPIIGIAEQSGLPVAVSMLPAGESLSEQLNERPVPLGEAMKQISQIAHTVAALHGLTPTGPALPGQQHGYLIPENLWVRDGGRVMLLDSGMHAAAAHAAFSSGFPLTPHPYAPPGDEAYAETNVGADVYALVALLVRLVTGRAPAAGGLRAAVEDLPEILPASLRDELLQATVTPTPDTAPHARALAVHLAFDAAWIHAQERTRRENGLVEGELMAAAGPARKLEAASAGRGGLTAEEPLRQWARAYPAAGVRGGAAAPAGETPGPGAPLARVVPFLAGSLARLRPRPGDAPEKEATPLIARYAVRLGPFADPQAAAVARARVRGAWPMAAVVAENGSFFVQVTTCSNQRRAEELVERLQGTGAPAEVSGP